MIMNSTSYKRSIPCSEAPPCRRVAAECLAGIGRIGAGSRLHVDDAHFENVARLGAANVDRTRAEVHAEAFAGASAEQLAVDRAGAAAVDALLLRGPQEHAFGARVPLYPALCIAVRVLGQRV